MTYCDRCYKPLEVEIEHGLGLCPLERRRDFSSTKTAGFPFSVNHVDGQPMVIESLHHLRKIERDYGVVFSAYSHASSNNVDPVSKDLPKFRGNDEDVRHDYRKRYRK